MMGCDTLRHGWFSAQNIISGAIWHHKPIEILQINTRLPTQCMKSSDLKFRKWTLKNAYINARRKSDSQTARIDYYPATITDYL